MTPGTSFIHTHGNKISLKQKTLCLLPVSPRPLFPGSDPDEGAPDDHTLSSQSRTDNKGVDTGHRARQKQVSLLPLEIEAPWPNRVNFSSLLSHFPRSFWTAWICVLKTWYLSVLYLQPTLNINQVNWEGELFIKHAHSNFID